MPAASGTSFHSDRPLLSPSAPTSPDGKLPAVAGVAASLPPPSQQQQQQQQEAGLGVQYSDQYLPSSPEQLAAKRGGRPQLAVVIPGGSPEPSLNGDISAQVGRLRLGWEGACAAVTWQPPHLLPDAPTAPPPTPHPPYHPPYHPPTHTPLSLSLSPADGHRRLFHTRHWRLEHCQAAACGGAACAAAADPHPG